jgi:sensor domain CHASE-containing protein
MALASSTASIGRSAGHRAAPAAAAIVLLLCLAAALAGDRLVRSAAIGEERAAVLARLTPYSNALSLAINRRLAALIGLKAFVEVRWAEPNFENEFDAFAAAVQSATPGILSLQYVLDGRVAHMFPRAGNEKALGLDL